MKKKEEPGIARAKCLATSNNEKKCENLEDGLREFRNVILKLDSILNNDNFKHIINQDSELRKELIELIKNYITILE